MEPAQNPIVERLARHLFYQNADDVAVWDFEPDEERAFWRQVAQQAHDFLALIAEQRS